MLCTEASPSQLMPSNNCNTLQQLSSSSSPSPSPSSSSTIHKSTISSSEEDAEDVKNGNSPNPIRRSFLESQTCIDVATLQFLNSHDENSEDENSDTDEFHNSSVNGFTTSSRRPIDSESEDDDDAKSSSAESTSCSENSFEMSSATSFASTLNKADQQQQQNIAISTGEGTPITSSLMAPAAGARLSPPKMLNIDSNYLTKRGPTYSHSMDSFLLQKPLSPQAREQISQELSELDTGLPQLDFASLEEKLSTAAKEHEASERRKLGDEVRRRLALQYDSYTAGPSPAINTRPQRSNFAQRLNASKNLQICYMNDLAEDDEDEDSDDDFDNDEDDEDDDEFAGTSSTFVPKSKSTPNLTGNMRRGINGAKLNASELARRAQPDAVGFHDRLTLLRDETQIMLQQAKKAAKMQMEVERQNQPIFEKIESKKLSRMQLSKMKIGELRNILDEIRNKIDVANADLVSLLMEKDSLYMEQDSMLVDIEDTIQHSTSSESLNLPSFLYVKNPTSPSSAPPTSRQNNTSISSSTSGLFTPSRWKIFKR
uniref:Schwannomin interacting protein 1 C-terminal domain-containing protein n=1 Tax=Panagrolaimus sp. PS1159 TaxID=55785 RepID=A0AC35FDI0_9BILA